MKRQNRGYAPRWVKILHRRPLPVKAKTSRAARFTDGAGLDSQRPPVFLVSKTGIPPKPACAGFSTMEEKYVSRKAQRITQAQAAGALVIIKNASHGGAVDKVAEKTREI